MIGVCLKLGRDGVVLLRIVITEYLKGLMIMLAQK